MCLHNSPPHLAKIKKQKGYIYAWKVYLSSYGAKHKLAYQFVEGYPRISKSGIIKSNRRKTKITKHEAGNGITKGVHCYRSKPDLNLFTTQRAFRVQIAVRDIVAASRGELVAMKIKMPKNWEKRLNNPNCRYVEVNKMTQKLKKIVRQWLKWETDIDRVLKMNICHESYRLAINQLIAVGRDLRTVIQSEIRQDEYEVFTKNLLDLVQKKIEDIL